MLFAPRITHNRSKPPWPLQVNPQCPLAESLVGAWTMSPAGGDVLYDLSGYGSHGTLTSMDPATDWTHAARGTGEAAGFNAPALEFDGSDQYVDVGNPAVLDLTGDKLSVFALFYPHQTSLSATWIARSGSTANSWYFRQQSNGRIRLFISGVATNTTAAGLVNANDWQSALGTYDGANLVVYQNGLHRGTVPGSGNIASVSNPIFIGSGGDYSTRQLRYDGLIGCIYVWQRALAPEDAMLLHVDPWCLFRPQLQVPMLASAPSTVMLGAGTATGRGLVAASAAQTHAAQATVSGIGDVQAAGTVVHAASATASGTGFILATAGVIHAATTAASGRGLVVGSALQLHSASASVTGAATVSASAQALHRGQAAATASGFASATATATHGAVATMTGSATVVAIGSIAGAASGQATVTGQGLVLAAARTTHAGQANRTGRGIVLAVPSLTHAAIGTATGRATTDVTAGVVHQANGSVTGTASTIALASVAHTASATAISAASVQATATVGTASAAPTRTLWLPKRATTVGLPPRATTARLCA